jgi:hypothetical protein
MAAVQVNDFEGKHLTKVRSGWTVAEALTRIPAPGFLEDKEGVICGGEVVISTENGPSVFTVFQVIQQQQQQQQQQPAFLIGAVVKGAKQSKGARGNVYKLLERHVGHYSEREGVQITLRAR